MLSIFVISEYDPHHNLLDTQLAYLSSAQLLRFMLSSISYHMVYFLVFRTNLLVVRHNRGPNRKHSVPLLFTP